MKGGYGIAQELSFLSLTNLALCAKVETFELAAIQATTYCLVEVAQYIETID